MEKKDEIHIETVTEPPVEAEAPLSERSKRKQAWRDALAAGDQELADKLFAEGWG